MSLQQTDSTFEIPPGLQSQVDWGGQARVQFGSHAADFRADCRQLTSGFSRRGFYWGSPNEQIGPFFLEAHERAFEHFGGNTREHLYDRARTVCRPSEEVRVLLRTHVPRLCTTLRI